MSHLLTIKVLKNVSHVILAPQRIRLIVCIIVLLKSTSGGIEYDANKWVTLFYRVVLPRADNLGPFCRERITQVPSNRYST